MQYYNDNDNLRKMCERNDYQTNIFQSIMNACIINMIV